MKPICVTALRMVCPAAPAARLEKYIGPLNATFEEFEINTDLRQAAFLGQVAVESGEFRYTSELWGPTPVQLRYDDREDLGNTKPEAIEIAARYGSTPGSFWRGHGLIQTTGYDNHCRVRDALNLDCVERPALLTEPMNAARSAGLFWHQNGLNAFADRNDWKRITRIVNGGYTHLDKRVGYSQAARAALA
jgi:putative chitinase